MRKAVIFPLAVVLNASLLSVSYGQDATSAHKDSLRHVVDLYYAIHLDIFKQNSTKKDVDKLFDLFTEDFVYVHLKYGGEYSRMNLYEGYLNNQRKGNYDGSIVDVKIKNSIIGLNGMVTERAYIKKIKSGELKEIDSGMTLFEFRDGRICKIVEYW